MPELLFQGPVAQLDRATVSGTVCRGFESLLVRFYKSAKPLFKRVLGVVIFYHFVYTVYTFNTASLLEVVAFSSKTFRSSKSVRSKQ